MTDIIDEVFGTDGLFASKFAGYEPRPGQVKLARAIHQAVTDGAHLLGEGPCGTGKTNAYIVPLAHAAATQDKTIVIATANIALQEQLITKDLPKAQEILPWKFTFGILKGMNNYLCDLKFSQAATRSSAQAHLLSDMKEVRQFAQISEWSDITDTGDVSELPFIPDPKLWASISTTAEDCLKKECPLSGTCRALKAKTRAFGYNIIVTNYHMLFADFAVRAAGGQGVLPEYNILVMDEAHEAPDIARDFFGFSVTQRGLEHLATIASNLLEDDKLAQNLRTEVDLFFNFLIDYSRSPNYKIRIKKPDFVDASTILNLLRRVSTAADLLKETEEEAETKARLKNLSDRASNAHTYIEEAVGLVDTDKVYWIEATKEGHAKLCGKSIFSGEKMAKHVYGSAVESIIALSATMTTGNPNSPSAFNFIRKELGAPEDVRTCVVDSPFDFSKQALVIVPENVPSPKDREFPAAVARTTLKAVQEAGGRTLGLYTSYKNLNSAYDAVKFCGYRVFKQGDLPRVELTRQFREDVTSVLLGTDSFWTGVDVPGESLTCLVIDRLPFTSPEDPIVDAISERDKGAFTNYHVPKAVITFRQGVGRLIRTQTDTGVVIILDTRIIDSNWGKNFFWSAMPTGIHARRDLSAIKPFLEWAKSNISA